MPSVSLPPCYLCMAAEYVKGCKEEGRLRVWKWHRFLQSSEILLIVPRVLTEFSLFFCFRFLPLSLCKPQNNVDFFLLLLFDLCDSRVAAGAAVGCLMQQPINNQCLLREDSIKPASQLGPVSYHVLHYSFAHRCRGGWSFGEVTASGSTWCYHRFQGFRGVFILHEQHFCCFGTAVFLSYRHNPNPNSTLPYPALPLTLGLGSNTTIRKAVVCLFPGRPSAVWTSTNHLR